MKGEYKKIAKLIVRDIFDELSEEEREELLKWKGKEHNHYLLSEIRNSSNFKEWTRFYNIDTQKYWNQTIHKIDKKRNRLLLPVLFRIVAAVILPLVLGGSIYYYVNFKNSRDKIICQEMPVIAPGKSIATLILDDGSTYFLDSENEKEIKEEDGTVIRSSGEKLDYLQPLKDVKENRPLYNTIKVPKGAEYSLFLSDSTKVYLNSLSEIKYPIHFSDSLRQVKLKGEAFFEVTKTGTPFIVKTDKVNIEVLGTNFNINAYGDNEKVVTTLVNGKVKVYDVTDFDNQCVLNPEEQAVYELNSRDLKVKKVNVSFYTGWKDGELIFYDMRLEDIMTILTRWYSAEVSYKNLSVKELRFSGSLDKHGDIRQILDIIEATKKVKIEIEGKTILFNTVNMEK